MVSSSRRGWRSTLRISSPTPPAPWRKIRRGIFLSFVTWLFLKIRNCGFREEVFLARSPGSSATSTWLQRGDMRNVLIIKKNFMELKGAINICEEWRGF
jgi:hypothetical protein